MNRHCPNIKALTFSLFFFQGAVGAAPPQFVDMTEETGIEFVFPGEDTVDSGDGDYGGGGIAVADFDGDGDLDMIVAGGYSFPMAFLRNDGDWHFTLHTGSGGLLDYGWEKGVTAADYDNDGDPDLFVAVADGNQQLLANNGNGTFDNVTASAGLSAWGDARVGVWTDYDRDGFLDLYVARYGSIPEGATNSLYHNNGDGTFSEVTTEAGIKNWPLGSEEPGSQGNTWMALAFDYNNDGFPDLYDGNDWGYKHYKYGHKMWENIMGALPFSLAPEATETEVLCNCMGPSLGDVNGDGWFDLYFANTYHGNLLLHNNCGTFANGAGRKGLEVNILSWSSLLADFDLNGELDLYVTTWHMGKNRMFLQHNGAWQDQTIATSSSGKYWESTTSVAADFDDDGDLDLAMINADSPMAFMRNDGPTGFSLRVRLIGTTSNRDAIGAVVRLHLRGERQHRTRISPDAFLSSSDPLLTFGLGNHAKAEAISVRWPTGDIEVFTGPFIGGSKVELIEGEGTGTWNAEIPWMAEFCGDGRDNDCDGEVDEGFALLGQPCTVGLGECVQPGIYQCDLTGTGLVCAGTPLLPRPERCDGKDNDCDGDIDENIAEGAPCSAGVGACRNDGTIFCLGVDGMVCDAVALPPGPTEICGNDIDEDCNGKTDEANVDLTLPCSLGEPPCDQTGDWTCGEDGQYFCHATGYPHQEVEDCGNGIDDDCDGEIDETNVPIGSSCPVEACQEPGAWACGAGGDLVCEPPSNCTSTPTPSDGNGSDGVRDGCSSNPDHDQTPPMWFLALILLFVYRSPISKSCLR